MRLGDYIDDRCSRCKRITDHAIVSMIGEEIAKVMCRTCNGEHKYHGSKAKKEMTKEEAFNSVLAKISAQLNGGNADPEKRKKPRRAS